MRRRRVLSAVVAVTALLGAGGTAHARPLVTGILDPVLSSPNTAERQQWLQRTADAGAQIARIAVNWSALAPTRPANPADPGDGAYDFAGIDDAVAGASANGLKVVLTFTGAPAWAEGPGRPAGMPAGSWRPDPGQVRAFAEALARRYSGSYEQLPRVRHYQVWNEPNLNTYLSPQYSGKKLVSPRLYVKLLNAAYAGIKAVSKRNVVISAGTAPFGDRAGGNRMRPLLFWRKALCVKHRRRPQPTSCRNRARFDVLAHNPINPIDGPGTSAAADDDITVPDMSRLKRLLRAAERGGNVGGPRRHRLWATELWWETDPPEPRGVSPRTQARRIEEGMYLLWKQGVSTVIVIGIRDTVYDGQPGSSTLQSGLYFNDGRAKPALRAFRFPFVAEHLGVGRFGLWTVAPRKGTVSIQRRAGDGWRTLARRHARPHRPTELVLKAERGDILRAKVGGDHSLPWRLQR